MKHRFHQCMSPNTASYFDPYLHVRPTCPCNHNARLDGRLRPARIHHKVDSTRTHIRKSKLPLHPLRIPFCVLHLTLVPFLLSLDRRPHIRSRILLRERQPRQHDIDRDSPCGAERTGSSEHEQPDGSAAEDGDGLSRAELAEVGDSVNADCEGLDLRS
jgi:hypothetical protein